MALYRAWRRLTTNVVSQITGTPKDKFLKVAEMLAGTVAGGWQLAIGALAAARRLAAGEGNAEFLRAKPRQGPVS